MQERFHGSSSGGGGGVVDSGDTQRIESARTGRIVGIPFVWTLGHEYRGTSGGEETLYVRLRRRQSKDERR